MTQAQVEQLRGQITTDLPTAGRVWGLGRSTTYELHRRGELPFPVHALGRKLVVPVAPLLASVGLGEPEAGASSAAADGSA